jgi:uncharacterized protein (DUF2062 family)
MKDGFFQRRVAQPVLDLLRQGTTPEKIALSIAFGIVLGVFPSLGWTTLLCFVAAFGFRLNLPAIQLVNYFVYPLQLLLLIPFIRAGEFVFRSPRMALSVSQILAMIKADVWHAIEVLWVATIHAIAVWALIAPVAIYVIYWIVTPIIKKFAAVSGLTKAKIQVPVVGKQVG